MSNVCTQANMIYTYVNLYVVSVTNININHKGLQRTANEYAGKRRIYIKT